MIDLIHFDKERIHYVMMNELKVGMADPVFHIVLSAGEKVVQTDHLMAFDHEPIDQIGSDESGAACHQYALSLIVGREFYFWKCFLSIKQKQTNK